MSLAPLGSQYGAGGVVLVVMITGVRVGSVDLADSGCRVDRHSRELVVATCRVSRVGCVGRGAGDDTGESGAVTGGSTCETLTCTYIVKCLSLVEFGKDNF